MINYVRYSKFPENHCGLERVKLECNKYLQKANLYDHRGTRGKPNLMSPVVFLPLSFMIFSLAVVTKN